MDGMETARHLEARPSRPHQSSLNAEDTLVVPAAHSVLIAPPSPPASEEILLEPHPRQHFLNARERLAVIPFTCPCASPGTRFNRGVRSANRPCGFTGYLCHHLDADVETRRKPPATPWLTIETQPGHVRDVGTRFRQRIAPCTASGAKGASARGPPIRRGALARDPTVQSRLLTLKQAPGAAWPQCGLAPNWRAKAMNPSRTYLLWLKPRVHSM